MNENENILTKDEKDLLDTIMNDKYSLGAFCGMIFNSIEKTTQWENSDIDLKIKLALNVRLRALELSK